MKEQRHTRLFKMGCEACKRYYRTETRLRALSAYLKETDFAIAELKNTLLARYKHVSNQTSEKKITMEEAIRFGVKYNINPQKFFRLLKAVNKL